jgi:hypothetical protein
MWIGLSDRVVEGTYQWVSTENALGYPPASGPPWAVGEPTGDSVQDYVFIGGDFHDEVESVTNVAVCECDDYPRDMTH